MSPDIIIQLPLFLFERSGKGMKFTYLVVGVLEGLAALTELIFSLKKYLLFLFGLLLCSKR